jgi:hypothetical protein
LLYFQSSSKGSILLYDAVSMVITMASDGQQEVNKRLEIKNISFGQKKVGDYEYVKDKISIYPNPLSTSSQLSFYTESYRDL